MKEMNAYQVWCPDLGSTRDDAHTIKAFSPDRAAEEWAQREDSHSADYWIVRGTDAHVVVQDEYGRTHEFTVSGESCAVYTARAKEL